MDILVPKNIFLRVADKFVPHFIDKDKAVASSPTVVYKKLFRASSDTGKSTLSQKHLSDRCKLSVRTVQYSLHRLSDLGYIRVDHEAGGCNTYVLLLSEYVMRRLEGYDRIDRSNWYPRPEQSCAKPARVDQPADAPAIPLQNVQGGYAKAAHPSYNVDKNSKNITPPTPFPTPQPFRGGSSASSEGIGGGGFYFLPKRAKPTRKQSGKSRFTGSVLTALGCVARKKRFCPCPESLFCSGTSRNIASHGRTAGHCCKLQGLRFPLEKRLCPLAE